MILFASVNTPFTMLVQFAQSHPIPATIADRIDDVLDNEDAAAKLWHDVVQESLTNLYVDDHVFEVRDGQWAWWDAEP